MSYSMKCGGICEIYFSGIGRMSSSIVYKFPDYAIDYNSVFLPLPAHVSYDDIRNNGIIRVNFGPGPTKPKRKITLYDLLDKHCPNWYKNASFSSTKKQVD